jgi:hypothetical protein
MAKKGSSRARRYILAGLVDVEADEEFLQALKILHSSRGSSRIESKFRNKEFESENRRFWQTKYHSRVSVIKRSQGTIPRPNVPGKSLPCVYDWSMRVPLTVTVIVECDQWQGRYERMLALAAGRPSHICLWKER